MNIINKKNVSIHFWIALAIQFVLVVILNVIATTAMGTNGTALFVRPITFVSTLVADFIIFSVMDVLFITKGIEIWKNILISLIFSLLFATINMYISVESINFFPLESYAKGLFRIIFNYLLMAIVIVLLTYFYTILVFLINKKNTEIDELLIANFLKTSFNNVKFKERDGLILVEGKHNKILTKIIPFDHKLAEAISFEREEIKHEQEVLDILEQRNKWLKDNESESMKLFLVYMNNETPRIIGNKPEELEIIKKRDLFKTLKYNYNKEEEK